MWIQRKSVHKYCMRAFMITILSQCLTIDSVDLFFFSFSLQITKHRWTFRIYCMHTSTNYTPLTYIYIYMNTVDDWSILHVLVKRKGKYRKKRFRLLFFGDIMWVDIHQMSKVFNFYRKKKFVLIINNNQTLSVMACTQNEFFQLEKSTESNNKFTWTSIAIIYSFILIEKPNEQFNLLMLFFY